MLGVEYGMIRVGALRILKPATLPDALRQKPQAVDVGSVSANAAVQSTVHEKKMIRE